MADKSFAVRVIMKHDTEANWARATNFIPKEGEVIVYTYTTNNILGNTNPRIKIGDGVRTVGNLPFVDQVYANHILNSAIHYTISVDTNEELLKFAYENE